MKIHFYKYHGTGNDFIIIDDRNMRIKSPGKKLASALCDRRFGIGADGLMFLRKQQGYDFRMVYYNSDGKESSMCGNGGRCIVAFAKQTGILRGKEASFIAMDGVHKAILFNNKWEREMKIRLQMSDVGNILEENEGCVMDTGSPHLVQFVNDILEKDVTREGRAIRNSALFKKKGINVNFVQEEQGRIFVRTYERGVEAETLSCGTGVIAAALASAYAGLIKTGTQNKVRVSTLGGELLVCFQKKGSGFMDIWLEGPATFVFKGEVNV